MTLSATLVEAPAHGQLTLNADGSFSYLPDDDYSGTDSFTYTAGDGVATSAPATVTIVISLPVANNDAITAISSAGRHGRRADQRYRCRGRHLNAGLGTNPSHGSLTLNPEWLLQLYRRSRASPGRTASPITATDWPCHLLAGHGDHHRLLVPVANADTYTRRGGQTLTCHAPGVLDNDTNADGAPLTATLVTTASQWQPDAELRWLLQLYADRRLLRHGQLHLYRDGWPCHLRAGHGDHHRLLGAGGQPR